MRAIRFHQGAALLLFSLFPLLARATPINIGDLSLVTLTAANPPAIGTIGFGIFNSTGDPGIGGAALPPDFPVFTSLTLQNLTLTYVIGGNSQSLSLGGLAPGSFSPPPGQQFPDTTLFDSAFLTGNISSSTFTLFNGSQWQATSQAFSALLLPSNVSGLTPDVDLALITVDANPVISTILVPEPSSLLFTFASFAGAGLWVIRKRLCN